MLAELRTRIERSVAYVFQSESLGLTHYDSLTNEHFSSKECCHDSIGRTTPGATDMFEPLPVEVFSTSKEDNVIHAEEGIALILAEKHV